MPEPKSQLDHIQETVELLARHLKPLPEQVTAVETKVDRLDKKVVAFRAETEANFAEVNDRLDTVETNMRGLDERVRQA
jgi:peptidoglycan hydrolase CwlO-like protein